MPKNIFRFLVSFSFLTLITGCVPMVVTRAGVEIGTGTLKMEDRRGSWVFIEDEQIELAASRTINEKLGEDAYISVTSFNRNVLLTGDVSNEAIRTKAAKLAINVKNVRDIFNEIVITPRSTTLSRNNDTLITAKVKSRFLDNGVFQINHVKVITENSVTYLAGMVKHTEGKKATELASSTPGVAKVVTIFEYLD
ncbi:MAG: BON domain-containing protein [Nitrosomonas sp.]|nr:BON domain-containing protein [Nitrosomonas sp.]